MAVGSILPISVVSWGKPSSPNAVLAICKQVFGANAVTGIRHPPASPYDDRKASYVLAVTQTRNIPLPLTMAVIAVAPPKR